MKTPERQSAYEVLGVSPEDNAETIRRAYRRLVMSYHPDQYRGDKAAANQKLVELIAAFDILDGPASKATGSAKRKPSGNTPPKSERATPKTDATRRPRATRWTWMEKIRPLTRSEIRAARTAERGFTDAREIINGAENQSRASVYA